MQSLVTAIQTLCVARRTGRGTSETACKVLQNNQLRGAHIAAPAVTGKHALSDTQLPLYDEFDLRPYLEATQRRWYWIVALALLLALAGFTYTTVTDALYESVALLRVVGPSEELQFESRIRSLEEEQPIQALIELALSDVVLLELRQVSEEIGAASITERELRNAVDVTEGREPSLLRFSVSHPDPDVSLALSEAWIAIFLEKAEAIYGGRNAESLQFFSNQRDTSAAALEEAEQALADFQRTSPRSNLEIRLRALNQAQTELLAQQQNTSNVARELNTLSTHLAQNPNNPLLLADALTALTLQLRAFGGELETPVQLQFTADSALGDVERAVQLEALGDLQTVLSDQQTTLDDELVELEATAVELQGRIETLRSEENRLLSERDIAQEIFTALSLKVEEEQISAQDTSEIVELIGTPVLREETIEDSRLLITAAGGVAGIVLGLIIVWGSVWWRSVTHDEGDLVDNVTPTAE